MQIKWNILPWIIIIVGIILYPLPKDPHPVETKFIAHRGGMNPENNLTNILYTLEQSFIDGIEVDLRTTKDNIIILYHDDQMTMPDGNNKRIKDLSFEEVNSAMRKYNNILTTKLEDIAFIFDTDKILHLDIKDIRTIPLLIHFLNKYELNTSNIIVDSIFPIVNQRLYKMIKKDEHLSSIAISENIAGYILAYIHFMFKIPYTRRDVIFFYVNSFFQYFITENMISYFHYYGVKIGVYGSYLDQYRVFEKFKEIGLDYIILDV